MGWGGGGGSLTALRFRLWSPCQLQNGVCFISSFDLKPEKSHAGKTQSYMIHGGLVVEMRRRKTAARAEKWGCCSWGQLSKSHIQENEGLKNWDMELLTLTVSQLQSPYSYNFTLELYLSG